MDTAKRISQLLEERGWTKYKLAIEAGLSQSTIANLFRRNNTPTLSTLEAICKAFGITVIQFLSEGEDVPGLSGEQKELFVRWSTLTKEQRSALLELMKTM